MIGLQGVPEASRAVAASPASGSPDAPVPTVLVAAGDRDGSTGAVWDALLELAFAGAEVASSGDPGGTGAVALAARGPDEAVGTMRTLLERGRQHLVVVPVDQGDRPLTMRVAGAALAAGVDELRKAYPSAVIHDLGRPIDGAVTSALSDLLATPQHGPTTWLSGAIARAFDGDPARLGRFISTLRDGLPAGTPIVLRGSAVAGRSYRRGTPFDADGPRTSDLDVVAVGESALAMWVPEAVLLGGVNTLPLSDDAPWVAPRLDRPRRKAQQIVRRPLSIQAMAGWFLQVRAIVQRQPYVVLNDAS